jgi:hypothetical protein
MNYSTQIFDKASKISYGADGDVMKYTTTTITPAYQARMVIVRVTGIAGLALNVNQTIEGTRTTYPVQVINYDGSDVSEYYFIKTKINGKDVFINETDLKNVTTQLGPGNFLNLPTNKFTVVKPNTYAYTPEIWINTAKDEVSLVPKGFAMEGTVVNIKTAGANGYSGSETKKYIKTTISGKELYIPFEYVMTLNQGKKSGSQVEEIIKGGAPSDSSPTTDDTTSVLSTTGKTVIGALLITGLAIAAIKILK